jgi:hypothetical protein
MAPFRQSLRRLAFAFLCLLPVLGSAQTLTINDASQTYPSLTNTTVTMTGVPSFRITGSGDPIRAAPFT